MCVTVVVVVCLAESNVGLPWGVKLKKPLVDSEYTPSDHSESQECSRYKGAQPISGRSLLDELQSWEQEQGTLRDSIFRFIAPF